MKRCLMVLVCLVWWTPAGADTWHWEDDQGTLNFTDDFQNIPGAYRKKAVKIGDVSAGTVQSPPLPAEAKSQASPAGATQPAEAAPPVREQAAGAGARYGGKTASEWREAFSALNAEIRETDGQLKDKQKLLKEPGTLPRSDYMKLEDEIRRLSATLTALLARWELLSKEANAVQVPAELRQ